MGKTAFMDVIGDEEDMAFRQQHRLFIYDQTYANNS